MAENSASRLAELRAPPIVGRFYMVPFVRQAWMNVEADWPVLGPMHADADFFAFPKRHYHVDARFVSASLARQAKLRDVASDAQSYPLSQRWGKGEPDIPDGRPGLKRMRCRTPAFSYAHAHQKPIAKLRAHYGDPAEPIRLEDGRMLCPHRKVDLSQFMPDADGLVIGPLHGLRVRCHSAPPISSPCREG